MKKLGLILVLAILLGGCGAEIPIEPTATPAVEPTATMEPTATELAEIRQTDDSVCDACFFYILNPEPAVSEADGSPLDVEGWLEVLQGGCSGEGFWKYLCFCVQEGWSPTLPVLGSLTPLDLSLEFIVIEKKCFGSAGCLVTIEPHLRWDRAFEGEWLLVYEIYGDEDGTIIDNIEIHGDTGSYSYHDVVVNTPSSDTVISLYMTDLLPR